MTFLARLEAQLHHLYAISGVPPVPIPEPASVMLVGLAAGIISWPRLCRKLL